MLLPRAASAAQGHDPDAARFLIKPEDNARSLTRLISQNKLTGLRDIARAAPPKSGATCFHTLLAGSGHLQVWRASHLPESVGFRGFHVSLLDNVQAPVMRYSC